MFTVASNFEIQDSRDEATPGIGGPAAFVATSSVTSGGALNAEWEYSENVNVAFVLTVTVRSS